MLVDAEYHCVWDNGKYESVVPCKYDTISREMTANMKVRDVFYLSLGNMTEQFIVENKTGEKHIIGKDSWYWVV